MTIWRQELRRGKEAQDAQEVYRDAHGRRTPAAGGNDRLRQGAGSELTHTRVLLKAERLGGKPGWKDATIANGLEVGTSTVERVCQQFVEEGLQAALVPRPSRRQYQRKLDGGAEAHLIALACSEAPEGRARWTLRLLAERMVALEHVDTVSYETVRGVLKQRLLDAPVKPAR